MGTECTDYPVEIEQAYSASEGRFGFIQSGISWLKNNRPTGHTVTYQNQMTGVLSNIYICLEMLTYGNTGGNTPYRVPYMFSNCIGGDVDMDAILNAMLAANFDQVTKCVGIIDAYRVAVWDAPFNQDFYAALARGWRIWQ